MSSQNLENLSIQELKKLVKKENEEVKILEEENEKKRLILAYKKLQNKKENLIQEKKNIKKPKFKSKSKSNPKPKFKTKIQIQIKTNTKIFSRLLSRMYGRKRYSKRCTRIFEESSSKSKERI